MKHRRSFRGVVIGALFLTACGSADVAGEPDTSAQQSETTTSEAPPDTADSTESTSQAPTTTVAPETTPTPSDRMVAPDFTLELGTGGSFTLSESDKPVYLIFWAEW